MEVEQYGASLLLAMRQTTAIGQRDGCRLAQSCAADMPEPEDMAIESVAGVSMFADTCAASLPIVLAHTHLDYHDAGWPMHCAVRRQTALRLAQTTKKSPKP
jgi:hypothetical protein